MPQGFDRAGPLPRPERRPLGEPFAASRPGREPVSFSPVLARSLVRVAAHRGGRPVGCVNVAGGGGLYAFVLDAAVYPHERRRGLGVRPVRAAAAGARACGARWLYVDFGPHLASFCSRCGFRAAVAGLMAL